MKKANVILSCIGILSVIGGALAFKVQHRFNADLFCYTTNSSHFPVPTAKAFYLLTIAANGVTMICTAPGARAYKPVIVRIDG